MRLSFLHVPVDAVDMEGALRRCEGLLSAGRPGQVITANPLMILAAGKDPALRDAFMAAELIVPDGVGLLPAAALQGHALSRVPGIELMERLCALAAGKGLRVFFLGASPGVAEAAADALKARYAGLIIAGVEHGYFTPADEPGLLLRVAAARPDILFVALPTPFQDAWIHRNKGKLSAGIIMGVGGSFDVFSGRLRRAPGWMRFAGVEWLFRFYQEPWRMGRLLHLPVFAGKVLLESVRNGIRGDGSAL